MTRKQIRKRNADLLEFAFWLTGGLNEERYWFLARLYMEAEAA